MGALQGYVAKLHKCKVLIRLQQTCEYWKGLARQMRCNCMMLHLGQSQFVMLVIPVSGHSKMRIVYTNQIYIQMCTKDKILQI